jgi:hypothetical protein
LYSRLAQGVVKKRETVPTGFASGAFLFCRDCKELTLDDFSIPVYERRVNRAAIRRKPLT